MRTPRRAGDHQVRLDFHRCTDLDRYRLAEPVFGHDNDTLSSDRDKRKEASAGRMRNAERSRHARNGRIGGDAAKNHPVTQPADRRGRETLVASTQRQRSKDRGQASVNRLRTTQWSHPTRKKPRAVSQEAAIEHKNNGAMCTQNTTATSMNAPLHQPMRHYTPVTQAVWTAMMQADSL